jgi:transcriptional regulator with XRE-family HTH domain
MANIYEYIGQKIRELRQNYPSGSLSQEALAEELNKPANTISRWETGKYKLRPEDLEDLARFFKVSITVFFPGEQPDDGRLAALTSATGGLDDKDFQEIVRYAEFRRARRTLDGARRSRKKT